MGYSLWGRTDWDMTEPTEHAQAAFRRAHRVFSTRSGCRLAERIPPAWLPDHLLLHWKATALRGPAPSMALGQSWHPVPLHTLTVGGVSEGPAPGSSAKSPTCGGFTKSATSHSRFPSSSIRVTETPLSLVMTETWGSRSCSW